MHLLVLGATGPTGKLVVEQALSAGHDVRALVRSPDKLTPNAGLEIVTGQATDPGDVSRAMASVDAVIVTLGAAKGTVLTDATRALLSAAYAQGVKRVVMLSSFAVQRERLSAPAKALTGLSMSAMIKDKTAAEQLLRDSDVDYTIVHASRLANGPTTTDVSAVPDSAPLKLGNSISRADVAAWLIEAAVHGGYSRSAVAIAS